MACHGGACFFCVSGWVSKRWGQTQIHVAFGNLRTWGFVSDRTSCCDRSALPWLQVSKFYGFLYFWSRGSAKFLPWLFAIVYGPTFVLEIRKERIRILVQVWSVLRSDWNEAAGDLFEAKASRILRFLELLRESSNHSSTFTKLRSQVRLRTSTVHYSRTSIGSCNTF